MTPWTWASILILTSVILPGAIAVRGHIPARFVAVQLMGSLATVLLVLLTFAVDQSSFIDLALGLSLVSVPGTLLFALFLERWL